MMRWHNWKNGEKPNWLWGGNECVVLVQQTGTALDGKPYTYTDHVFDYWEDGHWFKNEAIYGKNDENIIAWVELEKFIK